MIFYFYEYIILKNKINYIITVSLYKFISELLNSNNLTYYFEY